MYVPEPIENGEIIKEVLTLAVGYGGPDVLGWVWRYSITVGGGPNASANRGLANNKESRVGLFLLEMPVAFENTAFPLHRCRNGVLVEAEFRTIRHFW